MALHGRPRSQTKRSRSNERSARRLRSVKWKRANNSTCNIGFLQQYLIECLLGGAAIQIAPGNPVAALDAIARTFSDGMMRAKTEGVDPDIANATAHGITMHLDNMFANTRDRLVQRASKADDSGEA
jgi:hypothetical protein